MQASSSVQNQIKETQLVPVHISWDEVLYFNYLQELVTGHQQDVDKKTGLRAYPGLSMAIRIPEIREIFMAAVEMASSGEQLGSDIKAISDEEDKKIRARGIPEISSDSEPDIHKLEETGTGEDKVLVMMPLDVVRFLDILQGGENNDPKLGLQEFGFFKSVMRTVATVGGGILGGMLGGPLGAGAGAALGNTAGRVATGQRWQDAARASLPNAAYGVAGHYAAAASPWAASLGAAGTPSILGGAGAAGSGAGTAGAAGTTAAGASGATKAAASPDFWKLAKEYGPGLAMIGGGLFLGQKGDKRKEKEYREDKEKHDAANREAINRWNNNGLTEPLLTRTETPSHIRRGSGIKFYKGGGKVLLKAHDIIGKPIVGKGKGQEDLIHVDVPEKTWIHNATFVSDLGDGSTKAGQQEIRKLEKFALKNMVTPDFVNKFKKTIKEIPLKNVPCALSDGEDSSSPLTVAALGAGSNDKGAKILRDVVKEVRLHKISKGHKLPPPAPDLIHVYKKVAHKHLGGQI